MQDNRTKTDERRGKERKRMTNFLIYARFSSSKIKLDKETVMNLLYVSEESSKNSRPIPMEWAL
jgi:hypothetical protein